ncbi:MAG TPA: hypothetical protein VII99_15620 [Bacteroidia bacterium]
MKNYFLLCNVLTLALIFLFTGVKDIRAGEKTISVEDAFKTGLVSGKIFGKGGYTGDIIKLKMKNLSNHPVSLSVEAGRRLDSKDSTIQDILVTKSVTLALLGNETKTFLLSGMCCQAHNAAPDSGRIFLIGKMGDSNLVKLAQFIDLNKWYNNYIAQSAVWVISDNNPIEDIGGSDPVSKKLQEFVSKITGKPIPKYKIEYDRRNGSVYSGVPAKISGTFEYEIFNNGVVTFGIYDSEGHAVQMFFADVPKNRGKYVFNYEFKASDLPKGNYYVRLRLDGQIKKEEKFSF